MIVKRSTLLASVGTGLMVVALSGVLRRALADAPAGRYVVNAGEVEDTQTGLIWQQGDSISNLTWAEAQSYCTNLGLNDHTWRVPSIKELQTLVDESKSDPAIDTTAFPGTASTFYWSSSLLAGSPSYAWSVNFNSGGSTYNTDVTSLSRVRCVR